MTPIRGLADYLISATGRGAGNAMVKSLSLELAASNIEINAIAPTISKPDLFLTRANGERGGNEEDSLEHSGEASRATGGSR